MGLLQYINLHYFSKKSLNVGLLRLAQEYLSNDSSFTCESFILDTPFFQFHNFSSEIELFKTALFVPHNNQYTILFSHNFDNVTIQKSVSTFDFWNGMLPAASWISFSGSSLASLSQFFSESDREEIHTVHAKWICIGSKKCIFLVCTSHNHNVLDFTSLDDVIPALLTDITPTVNNYMPDTSLQNDSFNDIISQIHDGLRVFTKAQCFDLANDFIMESDILTKSEKKYILFELFCRLKFAMVKPNICFLSNNHTLKLIIFSHEEIDSDMYQVYLQQNMEDFFSTETLSNFTIISKGVFTTTTDIESYVLSGE